MAAKLTVLIPCKNERRNIRPCIESVQAIADELLIADSGSTDGTLDIVREMFDELDGECRIIEREYVNSADFKNWAIPQAQARVGAGGRRGRTRAAEAGRGDSRRCSPIRRRKSTATGSAATTTTWAIASAIAAGTPTTCCGCSAATQGHYQTRWVHAEVEMEDSRTRRLDTAFLHYTTWNTDDYLFKMNRYAAWGALNFRDEKGRKTAGVLPMITRAPLRFLQLYFLRLGFLDGIPGLQVCMFTAFYSFLKQAKLWEMRNAIPQPDPEAERPQSSRYAPRRSTSPRRSGRAKHAKTEAKRMRRAA